MLTVSDPVFETFNLYVKTSPSLTLLETSEPTTASNVVSTTGPAPVSNVIKSTFDDFSIPVVSSTYVVSKFCFATALYSSLSGIDV